MPDIAEIPSLIQQLGEADESIAAVYQTGDTDWVVAYDEVSVVDLTLAVDRQKLVLSAALGTCPAEQRLQVYTSLLSYSYLWEETDGVRMALAGEDGEAVQLYDLDILNLDAQDLADVLRNFAAKAGVWRNYIASGGEEAPPEDLSSFGVRV